MIKTNISIKLTLSGKILRKLKTLNRVIKKVIKNIEIKKYIKKDFQEKSIIIMISNLNSLPILKLKKPHNLKLNKKDIIYNKEMISILLKIQKLI